MGDKENLGSQKHPERIIVIRREVKKHWERLEEQVRKERKKGKRGNAFLSIPNAGDPESSTIVERG